MPSILEGQLKRHRIKHGLPSKKELKKGATPSILFSPQEAWHYDADSFSALGRHGIKEVSALEPDVAASGALFEGHSTDRDSLLPQQNEELNVKIRHLLVLLSPHFLTRGSQEIIEALLYRYRVDRFNTEDLIACGLPYHDSPVFTRVLQALQIKANKKWGWLAPFRGHPATLIRSMLAKYCCKELSILVFIGNLVQENVKLHKPHRALASLFAAVWLDVLALTSRVTVEMVQAVVPVAMSLLRKPNLRDTFHAALTVVAAISLKTDLDAATHAQLMDRAAKQVSGAGAKPAAGLLVLLSQLQTPESEASGGLSDRILNSLANAGPQALLDALPASVDCENLLVAVVEGCLFRAATAQDQDEVQASKDFAEGILSDSSLVDTYALPLAYAVLQAFCRALHWNSSPAGRKRATEALKAPLAALSRRQPLALGAALRKATDVAIKGGIPTEPLVALLVNAPGGGAVASAPGNVNSSMMPLVDALTQGSSEARKAAVKKAVDDLRASVGQEEDAPRQKVLASLVLQCAEDDNLEVASVPLGMKKLWSELPQVDARSAVRALESVFSRRLKNLAGRGRSLKEMFEHVLEDPRTSKLLPLVLQSFTWVYSRDDCGEVVRGRIDAALLPLIILCLLGLDLTLPAADKELSERLTHLRTVVLEFCAASKHPLLARLQREGAAGSGSSSSSAGGSAPGPLSRAAAQAADATSLSGLCSLAQAKPWPWSATVEAGQDEAAQLPPPSGILGGAAAQVAAAALLALAAPRVLGSMGVTAEAEGLAERCAEACQCFARHQSLVKVGEGDCTETLRQLLKASLSGLCTLEGQRRESGKSSIGAGAPEPPRRRRKSGASGRGSSVAAAGSGMAAFRSAAQRLLCLALERPRVLAAELGLSSQLPLMRPALLRVALWPDGPEARAASSGSRPGGARPGVAAASAASANALLLVRSLLLSRSAPEWAPDQSLFVAVVARLASAEAKEVRAAGLEVLKTFEGVDTTSAACWETSLAAALREAGVLRKSGEVLPDKAWTAAQAKGLELKGLSDKTFRSILESLSSHRTEIQQDCSGASLALSKFIESKGQAADKVCAFWGVGLSMLAAEELMSSSLILALPFASLLTGLAAPLQAAAEDAVLRFKSDAKVEAPMVLRMAASRVSEMARHHGSGTARAGDAAEEEAAIAFLKQVALPFCKGVTELLQRDSKLCSDSVAELVALLCQSFPFAIAWTGMPDDLTSEVVNTVFTLCVAASVAAANASGDATDVAEAADVEEAGVSIATPVGKVFAASAQALADAPLNAKLLNETFVGFPLFKREHLQSLNTCIAAELLCRQVAALKGERESLGSDGGELLIGLANLAKEVATICCGKGDDARQGDYTSTVEQLLLGVAALSEHLQRKPGKDVIVKPSVEQQVNKQLAGICEAVGEVSTALEKKQTPVMLLAIVRTCSALSTQVLVSKKSLEKLEAELPPPLQLCVQALTLYAEPLRADVLSLLKMHLNRLWRSPDAPMSPSSSPKLVWKWDAQSQSRMRNLLHVLVLEQPKLIEQVDYDFARSLATNAGEGGTMDWVMLLFLVRRKMAGAPAAAPAKRKSKKRRSSEKFAAELLAEVLPAQDDESTIDEALNLWMSMESSLKLQCLCSLMQTLSSIALGLCQAAQCTEHELALVWGRNMCPPAFLRHLDVERAFWLLNAGLTIATRFVSEHGLPNTLDGVNYAPGSKPSGALIDEEEAERIEGIPLSLCYGVWSVNLTEVLLDKMKTEKEPLVKTCTKQAQKARALLMRSLAVNHPKTFFRAVSLGLRVPKACPGTPDVEAFQHEYFMEAQAKFILVASKNALLERFQMREGADDGNAEDAPEGCTNLCESIMRHTCRQFLEGESGSWHKDLALESLRFLDVLCRFCGRISAKTVGEYCVPAAAGCLARYARGPAGKRPSVEVAVESGTYLTTAIKILGEGLLEHLNVVMPPLLDCIGAVGDAKSVDSPHPMQECALRATTESVKSMGKYLSPFLDRLMSICGDRSAEWKTTLSENLGWELVARVPTRLLLPAVQTAVATGSQHWDSIGGALEGAVEKIEAGVVRMQRLSSLLAWASEQAKPEEVEVQADGVDAALLRLLAVGGRAAAAFLKAGGQPDELPSRIFPRNFKLQGEDVESDEVTWANCCSTLSVLRLNWLVGRAFAKFAMHSDITDLKPRVSRIVEWARNTQAHTLERQAGRKASAEVEPAEDTEDASRLIALCAAMSGLVHEAPAVGEVLLLPLATKDLAAALGASRRCALHLAAEHRSSSKKRRRSGMGSGPRAGAEVLGGHTWWWFEVANSVLGFLKGALAPSVKSTSHDKVVEEALEALLEPCVNILDIFEFLPSPEESDVAAALCKAVQAALVVLAGVSDSAHMKRLLTAVLNKSRSDDVEVRLMSVKSCHRIWIELGVQAASGLSEVVMHASELLEDEDSRVEAAVRMMIKTMEECTGESLQDALKQ